MDIQAFEMLSQPKMKVSVVPIIVSTLQPNWLEAIKVYEYLVKACKPISESDYHKIRGSIYGTHSSLRTALSPRSDVTNVKSSL